MLEGNNILLQFGEIYLTVCDRENNTFLFFTLKEK